MNNEKYQLDIFDKNGISMKKYEYFHLSAARWMYNALLDCNALDIKNIAEICISFCEEKLETLYSSSC